MKNRSKPSVPHNIPSSSQIKYQYNFDRCYDETINNKDLYHGSVQHIVNSALKGINGCVFLYGQSGSGKTYTMMGYEKKK